MADQEGLADLFDLERSELLSEVPHGFFGSRGGRHQFGYGGPGEEREVRHLRSMAAHSLVSGAPLQAPHQVHSAAVVTIAKAGAKLGADVWPDAAEGRPVADAVVTDRNDVVLGIVTADCAPVLFADAQGGIVGAAHAGWRGAVSGEHGSVLENTIAAMEALGAQRSRIAAVVGPTIAQSSYEIDAAFREHFTAEDEEHFQPAPERDGIARWHFDLPGYILSRLGEAGLKQVAAIGHDTFAMTDRYHSFRRASQRGEPNYGRQISMIAAR